MRFAGGFAFQVFSLMAALVLSSCSKKDSSPALSSGPPIVETFPVSAGEFKNCRFKDQSPTYTFGSTIAPNPIVCDEGVATTVQLLTPSPLPNGLQFKMSELGLAGIANEKVSRAPYQFYIENSSGYQILKIQITVQ